MSTSIDTTDSEDAVSHPAMTLGAGSGRMLDFIQQLSLNERDAMKAMLGDQVSSFFDSNNRLRRDQESSVEQFDLLAETLRNLTPHSDTIPANGIAYRGSPAWVTADLLLKLQEEAHSRRDQPLDRMDHFLGCGGQVADALSVSPELVEFVAEHVGPVSPTGIASYLYYDQAGLGIRPHVDTEVFSVNLILMLRHEYEAGSEPSATVVFPARSEPEAYRLQIGEVMIMHGSSVIHGRSLVQQGEDIHLLTIGFNRIFPGN
ncbi:hypothetical protein [Paraherbaspirillum soli]|uniref:Fe2OG dioxygenase domain-containing protein n=1 Tax=Paraherbaspirillum soli TaxID=631222 RepID=A0ABW0M4R2_9BURK